MSARRAPEGSYAVGVRTLTLDPALGAPLPVTIWYPASTDQVAAGRFPVVIYSHGLGSRPELHAGLTTRWAAAGFVVAAPAYPHTRRAPATSPGPTYATSRPKRLATDPAPGGLDADPVDPSPDTFDLTRSPPPGLGGRLHHPGHVQRGTTRPG